MKFELMTFVSLSRSLIQCSIAILSRLLSSAFYFLRVPFWLSHSGCPFIVVLFCQFFPGFSLLSVLS